MDHICFSIYSDIINSEELEKEVLEEANSQEQLRSY